jgi:hypothetical protein
MEHVKVMVARAPLSPLALFRDAFASTRLSTIAKSTNTD